MSSDDDFSEFEEHAQSAFFSDASPVEFVRFALAAYSHRCAISGEQFHPEDRLPLPHLDVVLIRPMALGGLPELGNCLVLEEHVARAFRRGIVQVADDFTVLLPAPADLEHRLAIHVRPGNKLLLPQDPLFHPSQSALAFHRALFSGSEQ